MTIKERYEAIISRLKQENPNPATELNFTNPFETLVAVILSAQCTDKRVNMVTPALFKAYPTPQAMAAATPDDLLQYISSVSYPNNKARHLQAMAAMLVEDFDSQVPSTMEELTRLPGVGRKTANVIMGVVFHKAAIAVDTHVFRVSNRTGLANGKTPLEVEKALTRHIAEEDRYNAHHWLLLHGRYVCKALKPDCLNCGISQFCKYYTKK
ncbi:MAG: endonuclease III [Muribaculaceae bacterium]|nr:endonuclease III [Muribaculaceae bacterium]